MFFYLVATCAIFLEFVVQLNEKHRTLSEIQILASIMTLCIVMGVVPVQVCVYIVRDFTATNELFSMERKMIAKKKHAFCCK